MNYCNIVPACNIIITDKDCNLIVNDNTYNCDYIQVFILKLTTTIGESPTQTIIKENRYQKVLFNYQGDGFYTICKLTIPLDEMKPIYYKNGKFYHNIQEISLQEVLDTNTEISQIKFEYFYHFSICNLKKCFIKICQDIFDSSSTVCKKSSIDGQLIYKRDLLWSAINVINYMTEMDQMEEAQRLLEEITKCNGLCSPQTINNTTSRCGCGK